MGHLTIAIDFDDTFTADTQAWTHVIKVLQSFGHVVFCVSARTDFEGNRRELLNALPDGVCVFLSGERQKAAFIQEQGQHVDIWIDDCPSAIPTIKDLSLSLEWAMDTENGVDDV